MKRDFLQEFEITLTKIKGSLGFTLRKEDDSALGHYVRALVREPALTDGRIQAGDKIIAVSVIFINSHFISFLLLKKNNFRFSPFFIFFLYTNLYYNIT